jgi:hydrogen peroxide-dependent heme synthase
MSERIDHINATIRYTNWTALKAHRRVENPQQAVIELQELFGLALESGVELRGAYDLRGFRSDADLLLWIHGPEAEDVQKTIADFLRSFFGSHFSQSWSAMGLHRPAEFNRSHVPGFMLGHEAKEWLCMYPFVRSYDWYLIPETERREMLVEHGKAGSEYPDIVSSTVASFGLGDYEWLLALECDELYRIVDMMRDLRYTKARMHVREEIPFFTGKRINVTEMGEHYQ